MAKGRRKRRHFTPEYKDKVVELIRSSGRSIGQVARELELTETCVRAWVQQADVDAGKGPKGALTTQEREELRELRQEVKTLRMEREILKKATAFFAKHGSHAYRRRLEANGIVCSMSRKGDCWDNAVAESFFATLKGELGDRADFATRKEAINALFDYIEVFYNRQRRHSSIGYVSPVEFENGFTGLKQAA